METTLTTLVLLLVGSAFFSACETAFTSLSLMQIKEIQKKRPKRGKQIEVMYHTPERVITTLLIGNNVVNTSISVLTTEFAIQAFGDTNLGIVTGIITMIILVFGEVTPKQLAIKGNKFLITHSYPFIRLLMFIFFPLNLFLGLITVLLNLGKKNKARSNITAEGILYLIDHAEDIGVLDDTKTKMVRSAFRFSDVTSHAVMTHRTHVFSFAYNLSINEVVDKIIQTGYARIPVYKDHPENVCGIVLEKEVIRQYHLGRGEIALKDLMVSPVFVQENWRIQRVFALLKHARIHMAIVLDEYGGLAGILTINDLVEQFIGELSDEGDLPQKTNIDRIVYVPELHAWRVDADISIYQFAQELELEEPSEVEHSSIAGYLESITGHIAEPGETIHTPLGTFMVEESTRTVIKKVRFLAEQKHSEKDSPETDAKETQ